MRFTYLCNTSPLGSGIIPNLSITSYRCSTVREFGRVLPGRIIAPVNLTPLDALCRLTFRGCSVRPSSFSRQSLDSCRMFSSRFLSLLIATKSSTYLPYPPFLPTRSIINLSNEDSRRFARSCDGRFPIGKPIPFPQVNSDLFFGSLFHKLKSPTLIQFFVGSCKATFFHSHSHHSISLS